MRIHAVELRRVALPLVRPFRSAHGEEREREVVVVRVLTADGEGWGECAALTAPGYTAEYADGAHLVLRGHLVPLLLAAGAVTAAEAAGVLAPVAGHPMAKAALEMALLDLEGRAAGRSLSDRLGGARPRVPVGATVGFATDPGEVGEQASAAAAAGYRRVRGKIQPGWDIEPLTAAREAIGADVALAADANGSYTVDDPDHLGALDRLDRAGLGLEMLEQPLPARGLAAHAELAQRLRTPLALDESVTSRSDVTDIHHLGAAAGVNVKAGRVGGLLEAVRVLEACGALGLDAWVGGMLETGIGRAAALALAARPEATLASDVGPSDRYFAEDLTEPFVLDDGCIRVPAGPGLGVTPLSEVLARATRSTELLRS